MNFNSKGNGCLNSTKLPRHIAVIMDGNGRWAKQHLLSRVKGHEKGVDTVRMIIEACRELNIEILTLYAFSTENWQRPEKEVNALMGLLKRFLLSEKPELISRGIRLNVLGQIQRLPQELQSILNDVITVTAGNRSLLLNLALSYGGRMEITEMVRAVATKVTGGKLTIDAITEQVVADHLYTRGIQDPDLLIRTSGELRISNFLLWQMAYTEIAVVPTLWPDFSREEFESILLDYQNRERRYGKVTVQ